MRPTWYDDIFNSVTLRESRGDRQWRRGRWDCSSCSAQSRTCNSSSVQRSIWHVINLIEIVFSHIFSCISSSMWFIISSLSLVRLASVSTSKNFDLYSRRWRKNIGVSFWLEVVFGMIKNFLKLSFASHLFSCHMGNLVNFTSVLNLKSVVTLAKQRQTHLAH